MDSTRDWAPATHYKKAQLTMEPKQYTSRDEPTSASNSSASNSTRNLDVRHYTLTRADTGSYCFAT